MANYFIHQLLLERLVPVIISVSSGNHSIFYQSATISIREEKLALSQSTSFVSVCLPELPLLMDICESFPLPRRSVSTFKLYVQPLCIKNWIRENDSPIAKYLGGGYNGCFCMKCSTSQKFLITWEILNWRGKKTRRVLSCRRISLSVNSDSCLLLFLFSSFS